ncbi:MAG: membrane protein insertase YidC [Candidatus Hydrogenedentes bacterium]|nr:membrane protein insertase YidC [Candidatus Hydrogenedentota bacterium]
MQRNHTIAILLMTALVLVYFYFVPLPQPPTPSPVPAETVTLEEITEAAETGTVSAFEKQVEAMRATDAPVAPAVDASMVEAGIAALLYDPETAPATEYTLANDHLELVFTDVGARLKQSTVLVEHGTPQSFVPQNPEKREDEVAYPMSLRFQEKYLGDLLNGLRWTRVPSQDGASLQFSISLPEPFNATLTKTFALSPDHPSVLHVTVAFTNTGSESQRLGLDTEASYSLFWAPNVDSGDADNRMAKQELVWREEGANSHFATSKLGPTESGDYAKIMQAPDWVAVKSAYFVVAMKAEYEGAKGWADGDPDNFQVALDVPRVEIAPGATDTREFQVYLGPAQGSSLAAAWPGLKSVLQFFTMFGFMDTFAKILLWLLNFFHGSIWANYGFAIIFLTIVVRTAMFPLTLKGTKNMKKMQKLGPEMERIKKEVGDDQQEQQKRMMALYKERGVNPLGGCMPMILQMPVFFAMYRVYATAFEFRGAPFIGWITDLAEPDALYTLPFAIPIPFMENGINTLNLLPILMGLAMVASTKLMPTSGPVQNPQQKMIMTFMPVMFSVICYNMASGLNLYILTSTVLGIVQNHFIHVGDDEVAPKAGTPGKSPKSGKSGKSGKKSKPKHFYAAAQARKRETAKEQRREKKKGKKRAGKTQDH